MAAAAAKVVTTPVWWWDRHSLVHVEGGGNTNKKSKKNELKRLIGSKCCRHLELGMGGLWLVPNNTPLLPLRTAAARVRVWCLELFVFALPTPLTKALKPPLLRVLSQQQT